MPALRDSSAAASLDRAKNPLRNSVASSELTQSRAPDADPRPSPARPNDEFAETLANFERDKASLSGVLSGQPNVSALIASSGIFRDSRTHSAIAALGRQTDRPDAETAETPKAPFSMLKVRASSGGLPTSSFQPSSLSPRASVGGGLQRDLSSSLSRRQFTTSAAASRVGQVLPASHCGTAVTQTTDFLNREPSGRIPQLAGEKPPDGALATAAVQYVPGDQAQVGRDVGTGAAAQDLLRRFGGLGKSSDAYWQLIVKPTTIENKILSPGHLELVSADGRHRVSHAPARDPRTNSRAKTGLLLKSRQANATRDTITEGREAEFAEYQGRNLTKEESEHKYGPILSEEDATKMVEAGAKREDELHVSYALHGLRKPANEEEHQALEKHIKAITSTYRIATGEVTHDPADESKSE